MLTIFSLFYRIRIIFVNNPCRFSNFNIKTIELYDVMGRLIETSIENTTTTSIDISEKQNGIYFVKVGTATAKFIKE